MVPAASDDPGRQHVTIRATVMAASITKSLIQEIGGRNNPGVNRN